MKVVVIWRGQPGCLSSCFITNAAEDFTSWYPRLQIKTQIQFASENTKRVTVRDKLTVQLHNWCLP